LTKTKISRIRSLASIKSLPRHPSLRVRFHCSYKCTFFTFLFPDGLDIKNWPCTSIDLRQAISRLRDTHTVKPLNAWDTQNHAIKPQDYRRLLQGAVVEAVFSISRFTKPPTCQRSTPVDVYIADIIGLYMISDPIPLPLFFTLTVSTSHVEDSDTSFKRRKRKRAAIAGPSESVRTSRRS